MASNTPLKQLSVIAGNKGLSDLHIPTITEDAEDVVGMQGRIRLQKDDRLTTSQWMDKQRNTLQAYEYLCHIGEAKEWIEDCLQEEIDPIIKLEETMRNGIILAKLAAWFTQGVVRKIFMGSKLQFRHSDNINYFFEALRVVRLPQIFWFELTDLYEKKNIPKVIYCIHALSHLLARRNMAPSIKNLFGQLQFTNEELRATQKTLDSSGVVMPNFMNVGSSLRRELNEDFDEEFDFSRDGPTTPDLIIEEDEDSEAELQEEMNDEQRLEAYWNDHLHELAACQAQVRGWLARKEYKQWKDQKATYFVSHASPIQAQARGRHMRREFDGKDITFEAPEEWVTQLQSAIRGCLARMRYQRTLAYYHANIDKVVKVQNFIKNKILGNAYRKLTTDSNPSIGTVKNFIHLLDDSDLDFDKELALEEMRQQVIQLIRDNNEMDNHVNALDIQIGLFLRNAITIDEVVRNSSAFKKKQQHRRMSELASNSLNHNPYSLRGIDKESRKRLDLYQRLIYLLQTEPAYLARLLSLTGRHDLGEFVNTRLIEATILTLFGYATNAREEYLLINLCRCCIDEEVALVESTQEFMRSNYIFMKLIVQTNRGAKERMFFRKMLSPLVKNIVENEYLDLETDPVAIYHKAINDEESRTGRPSKRRHAATVQEALNDPEVRDTFVLHLRHLREITMQFLMVITENVDDVPYGVRIIARKLRLAMEEAFPNEPQESILRIIGHFIYYRYLNPAIVAPEQYDVIDAIVLPVQRKNLAEIAKMLQQISSGKVFDDNDLFLAPLNDFVLESAQVFSDWFMELTNVEEPETYFDMHDMNDHISTHKPIVYISPYELFHLHYAIETSLDDLDPDEKGLLRGIIQQLGPSPYHPSLELPDSMLCLTLNQPSEDMPMDPAAQQQQLLVDAKRLVIYILKLQSGSSLREILQAPVTAQTEREWNTFKEAEFPDSKEGIAAKRRFIKLGQSDPALDLKSLNFYTLKKITNRVLSYLTGVHLIPADDNYQHIINMIARDITGKNTRRSMRDAEISRVRLTLVYLKQKQQYLTEQREQYEGYLTQCMTKMANKRGQRPRYGLPFTRQYFHVKRLKKQGLEPKFGSFKYTAKQLHERGILLDIENISPKLFDKISIILSMDQVGIVTIEGSYSKWSIQSVQVDMRYEELLQTQFEGVQTMKVLDGMVKVNVNLLIYLINKKFYA
ncbi:hypothetical protein VTP01DRAFT_435 [Rhizomucor pusillus]|uniref:uncharacterized protein n=1 Tax=Rhizomucor pusillus TaxID=4840 RepID=UPI0037439533